MNAVIVNGSMNARGLILLKMMLSKNKKKKKLKKKRKKRMMKMTMSLSKGSIIITETNKSFIEKSSKSL